MLYSKLLGRTTKQIPADEKSRNAQLLIRGGFIQKEMAGFYAFMPLGKKVLDNIIQIIREEMNKVGGQEIHLSAMQSPVIWQQTDRWDDEKIDVWFKTKLQNESLLGLATTHEEPLTHIMKNYIQSYKDLPVYPYQFQTKFRNELRARSGLLRTREFIMKDLYSFNKNAETHNKYYEKVKEAYHRIFDRLGIGDKTYITFASGGPFNKYSHEFQTVCENGEDTIYLDKNKKTAINKEVLTPEVIEDLDLNKENLEEVSAIEVGNIFKLGTRFSEALGLKFTDQNGEEKHVVMGSYGVGPARVMATIVELYNDKNGIIWPENIAPYKVHLVGLNLKESSVNERALETYEKLQKAGIEILFDDRKDVSAGEKFAEADLIGIPYRVVISKKTGNKIGVKKRDDNKEKLENVENLINHLTN